MLIEFEPWMKYPDLTEDRLVAVANEIRHVRSECVMLHRPEDGDGNWCLSCRVYERTFRTITRLSSELDWLKINSELNALQFSFRIGSVPLRFYKGRPKDPPSRYLTHSDGEIAAIQLCLALEGTPVGDTVVRLAVAVGADLEVSSISLVEIDEYMEPIAVYRVPVQVHVTNVVPMQAPPVSMPPAIAAPRKREQQEEVNAAAG
ncbi:MAG: hypothetical protein ACRYFU_16805 [Janthinobacterium lividum]